jgi:hypothetical protein
MCHRRLFSDRFQKSMWRGVWVGKKWFQCRSRPKASGCYTLLSAHLKCCWLLFALTSLGYSCIIVAVVSSSSSSYVQDKCTIQYSLAGRTACVEYYRSHIQTESQVTGSYKFVSHFLNYFSFFCGKDDLKHNLEQSVFLATMLMTIDPSDVLRLAC